jgi:HlyD family secretion protein
MHTSESVVEAGETLAEIGDPRDLEIVVDLLSPDAVKVRPGQRVVIDGWGGEQALEGRVRLVEPFGFTKISALGIEEQRVNVVIDLESPQLEWARLAHGYQVDVRIVLWEREDVLKLPLTALFRHGSEWAVFAAEDGRARLQIVSLGQRNQLSAEITEGLVEGDRVVLHPSDRVAEGVRIAPRD